MSFSLRRHEYKQDDVRGKGNFARRRGTESLLTATFTNGAGWKRTR